MLYPHTFVDSNSVLYGQHDPSGQTIKICGINNFGENRHPQSVEQTFMHEVLHAIDNVYGAAHIQKHEDGEDIIDQMAEGLLQVIRDNKLDFREDRMGKKGKDKKGMKPKKGCK